MMVRAQFSRKRKVMAGMGLGPALYNTLKSEYNLNYNLDTLNENSLVAEEPTELLKFFRIRK